MPRTLFLALCGLLLPAAATADSWYFPPEETREEHRFGDTRIVEIVDARKNSLYPDFTVEVWRGKTLLARYPGVGFEKLFAAPDQSLFVGLSNRGLPGTAVIILRGNGELVLEAKHDLAVFEYCRETVTVLREWFDPDRPTVEFVKDDASGANTLIRLRTCDGRQVNLLDTVMKAYHRAVERNAAAQAEGASAE